MKKLRLNMLPCIFILISGHVTAQTLEQAVSITLSSNPDLKSAFNQYQSRLSDTNAAAGAYLPKIDLDAGVGYEGIDPASSNSKEATDLTRKEASITLTQLIWDGSATLHNISRTEAEAEADRYQLLADASDKALEVAKVYLDAVKANEIIQLAKNNLSIHTKIYKDIKRRAESGLGTTADVSQVEARIAKAKANLIASENDRYEAYSKFQQLVGETPVHLIFPQADQKMIPQNLEDAKKQALELHPTLKVAQQDIDAARYQYKQSKAPYYPTISVEAAHTLRDDAGGYEGDNHETTAMLRLRYNLYNGGTDKAKVQSSAYLLNKAKDLREKTYREVVEGLELSWNTLDFSTQRKVFLANHVDSVSQTVIAYEKQYQIGQRTLLDLLNSENELFDARQNYLESKYTEQYAKYRVMNAIGDLLSALKLNLPHQWTQPTE